MDLTDEQRIVAITDMLRGKTPEETFKWLIDHLTRRELEDLYFRLATELAMEINDD